MSTIRSQSNATAYLVPQRVINVKAYLSGSESPSDDGSDPPVKNVVGGQPIRLSDVPHDCFAVMKTVKFLRIGRPNACVTALATLLNFNLLNTYILNAVCEQEGLDMLVNLCEVDHLLCRLGALKVLRVITVNPTVAARVVDLGLIPTLLRDISQLALDIKENAVVIISHMGHLRRASKALRRLGGIPMLVSLLKIRKDLLVTPAETLTAEEQTKLAITKYAAEALWKFSRFTKNKIMMFRTGVTTFLTEILVSGNRPISIPVSGILSECSNLVLYQVSIETEGLVGVLVHNLTKNDTRLQWSSAFALMRAAGENEIVREMIRFHGGLPIILDLVRNGKQTDLKLMAAAIGALWKSAILEKNVEEFDSLGAVESLVRFIDNVDLQIKINAVGGLAEMAKIESARKKIVASKITQVIVRMLMSHTPELLANAAHFVGQISLSPEGMDQVEECDGVRRLWSLLRSRHRNVRLKTLGAVKNTVTRTSDGGETIRQLTGAMELLGNLLKDKDIDILTGVAGVIGEVALDRENLAVMTEQGVIRRLSALVRYKGENDLTRELCSAIAHCGGNRENLKIFRRYRIIPELTCYLGSKDGALKRQACRCFCNLSRDPLNCVSMHAYGAVPFLIEAVDSTDTVTQLAAAGCIANIRRTLFQAGMRFNDWKCRRRAITR